MTSSISPLPPLLCKFDPFAHMFFRKIKKRNLTYLSGKKLASIYATCSELEYNKVPGIFIEAGCALGGSTILIARTKDSQRKLKVYDVFGMIPAPSDEDTPDVHDRYQIIVAGESKGINGDKYYGYEDDLLNKVVNNLESFNIDIDRDHVELIKGLLQNTMQIDEPVAFAHIDVDWFDPVNHCLHQIFPNLSIGGSIVLDDYYDWGGCRKAVDEYVTTIREKVKLTDAAGSLKISKIIQ